MRRFIRSRPEHTSRCTSFREKACAQRDVSTVVTIDRDGTGVAYRDRSRGECHNVVWQRWVL